MDPLRELWKQATQDVSATTYVLAGSLALVLYLVSWCRIFAKAGHHPALAFVMLLPGINLLMLTILALGRWPIERELNETREVRQAVNRANARTLRRVA